MNTPTGAAVVRQLVSDAKPYDAEPPQLLRRALPPAAPFPVKALGDMLRPAAKAIQAVTQAPIAIAAQSVLAAATLAVQGHADVTLPTEQHRPLSMFFLTIAASGERKSACDTEALQPIRHREAQLRERHRSQQADYDNDYAAFEAAKKRTLAGKGDREAKRAALEALGPPPVAPLLPILTAQEPTLEGLHKLLAVGWPSVGVFSAEGGQFFGGHAMSDDAKLRSAAGLSCLWDGVPIQRVRAIDGATVLPGRRVCMHLLAQPDASAEFLADRTLADQGLLSRFLVVAPVSTMGSRMWREPPGEARAELRRYQAHILQILEAPLQLAEGSRAELAPRQLPLNPQARQLWTKFADHVEGLIVPGGEYEPIRGLANKLPEHAARLAGVLTLIGSLSAGHVSGDAMAQGIELANHYASEALRLSMAGTTSPKLGLAESALEWCRKQPGGLISLPDLYQRGPNAIRTKAKAQAVVETLVDHGWLVPVPGGIQRRRETWRAVAAEVSDGWV